MASQSFKYYIILYNSTLLYIRSYIYMAWQSNGCINNCLSRFGPSVKSRLAIKKMIKNEKSDIHNNHSLNNNELVLIGIGLICYVINVIIGLYHGGQTITHCIITKQIRSKNKTWINRYINCDKNEKIDMKNGQNMQRYTSWIDSSIAEYNMVGYMAV